MGVELIDLLLKPSQMLLDVSTLGLERLYDLLNTRQMLLLTEGVSRFARLPEHVGGGYRAEAEEYRELDAGRVLVTNKYIVRGKTSGLELGQIGSKGASRFHIRDCKVVKLVLYWDRARAVADLGLTPDTGSPGS